MQVEELKTEQDLSGQENPTHFLSQIQKLLLLWLSKSKEAWEASKLLKTYCENNFHAMEMPFKIFAGWPVSNKCQADIGG